jgi:hypothetical protein
LSNVLAGIEFLIVTTLQVPKKSGLACRRHEQRSYTGHAMSQMSVVQTELELGVEWKPFTFEGTTYSLDHLHPRIIAYEVPAKGDSPAASYKVYVFFALHCFTRGLKENETPNPNLLYSDNREERVFDLHRYELSKHLPGIIASLLNRKCFNTGHGTFLTIEVVDENGKTVRYEIYLDIWRAKHNGCSLKLAVRSAFPRENNEGPKSLPAIAFRFILYNKLNNKPIKLPKR